MNDKTHCSKCHDLELNVQYLEQFSYCTDIGNSKAKGCDKWFLEPMAIRPHNVISQNSDIQNSSLCLFCHKEISNPLPGRHLLIVTQAINSQQLYGPIRKFSQPTNE